VNYRRMILTMALIIVALFVLMFFSGMFMHGDP